MIELWFSHLSENIATVRESCAIALANASKANKDLEDKIKLYIKENLMKAKKQEPESEFASYIPKDVKFDLPGSKSAEESKGS